MSDERLEIDFSLDPNEIKVPKCRHGPTLLFRSSTQRFFACSACRDRRDCQIYVPFGKRRKNYVKQFENEFRQFRKLVRQIQKKKKRNFFFCHTCSNVFFEGEQSEHVDHRTTKRLTRKEISRPCQTILQPLKNKRSDAQFFFSSNFIDYFIGKIVEPGQWDAVLCIGCPTLFENLREKSTIRSFLLDFDLRLCSFYSSKKMLLFNMFNGHVFSREKTFREEFLSSIENCLVVVDPPFGGFHRALAHSLDEFWKTRNATNIRRQLILFNPYFLSKWVVDAFPQLKMLDYKIEYSSTLNLCRGRKGSPVRIFTDVDPSLFPPVDDENYKFCFECNRFVFAINRHCFQCQTCPSKNGQPSRHCSECQRCVQADRKHCSKCSFCHLPNRCEK